jgi:hypothetical protein
LKINDLNGVYMGMWVYRLNCDSGNNIATGYDGDDDMSLAMDVLESPYRSVPRWPPELAIIPLVSSLASNNNDK